MANILVVYHDQIPKYRARLRDPGTQDRTLTQTKGDDTYTCVCVPNWHQPASLTRRIKSIQDYTDINFTVDASLFYDCDPFQYDAYIFVPPLDMLASKCDPQALLTYCMRTNIDAYYLVVDFLGFELELLPFESIRLRGTKCNTAQALISADIIRREFEGYLSFRMSHDLSELFSTRIGITPGQMLAIETLALSTQCDVPELSLRYEMSDGAMVTLQDASCFSNYTTNESSVEAVVHAIEKNKSIDDLQTKQQLGSSNIPKLLTSMGLMLKHMEQQGPACYDRLVALAAMNFISNPFADTSSRKMPDLVKSNLDCIARLYPKSVADQKDCQAVTDLLGILCDLNRGASELLEYNERLVDVFLDVHDHVLNALTRDLTDLGITLVGSSGLGHGLCFKKEVLVGTHLPIQSGIDFSYVGSSATQVACTFNITMRNLGSDEPGSHHSKEHQQLGTLAKDACRLLSKKYMRISQGGGFHLTDFGASVYSLTKTSYRETLTDLDSNPMFSGLISIELANKRLADAIANVAPKKLRRKHLTITAKAKGKEREFQLVLKNTRRGKQAYWKSNTIIRGIRPKLTASGVKLKVLPNLSLGNQSKRKLTALIKCSCGELVALWKYDVKIKKSVFKCVACGNVHDHYINFRRI